MKRHRFRSSLSVTELSSEISCSGGPPYEELVHAVEDGTVNITAVHHMMAGFAFESYSEMPTTNEYAIL
jgi:hypothetical protein